MTLELIMAAAEYGYGYST